MIEIKILGATPINQHAEDELVRNSTRKLLLEASQIPESNKSFKGKLFPKILEILNSAKDELLALDSKLSECMLKPVTDMGVACFQHYSQLDAGMKNKIDEIRTRKNRKWDEYVLSLTQSMSNQVLTADEPKNYHKQKNNRTCTTAVFCMIYEDITGQRIDENELLQAASSLNIADEGQLPGIYIPNAILFNIFSTEEFKLNNRNKSVRVMDFIGVDFEDIQKFLDSISYKDKGVRAYCFASVASEVVMDGTHSIILISADSQEVTIHDPSPIVGSENKKIPQQEFAKRWSANYFSGKLILAF